MVPEGPRPCLWCRQKQQTVTAGCLDCLCSCHRTATLTYHTAATAVTLVAPSAPAMNRHDYRKMIALRRRRKKPGRRRR